MTVHTEAFALYRFEGKGERERPGVIPVPTCREREPIRILMKLWRSPIKLETNWVPAFAGMTRFGIPPLLDWGKRICQPP